MSASRVFNRRERQQADLLLCQLYMEHLPDTSLAYLAGIVDGEGSISLYRSASKNGTPQVILRLTITNTDVGLLDWIKAVTGVGHVRAKVGMRLGSKLCCEWVAFMRQAEAVLRGVLPYLRVKDRQADLALKFMSHQRPIGGGAALTRKEIATRGDIWQVMRELNGKT